MLPAVTTLLAGAANNMLIRAAPTRTTIQYRDPRTYDKQLINDHNPVEVIVKQRKDIHKLHDVAQLT